MLRPEDAVVKHSIEYTYTVVFASQPAHCGLVGCSGLQDGLRSQLSVLKTCRSRGAVNIVFILNFKI